MTNEHSWQAKWISAEPSTSMPVFRRIVELDKPIVQATAHVCGLGHFELSINGHKVGEDVLEPGWTDYAKTCLYVSHDVTSLLCRGPNTITVMLGNGMYNVVGTRYKKFKRSFGPPKLILQISVQFSDETSTTIVSDESWQTAPGPITFSCIYGGEDYDARLGNAQKWRPAIVTQGPSGRLLPQTSPPIRVMQTFRPVKITEPRPGVRVYDLGRNFSGWPSITAQGPAGAKITLTTGELLDEQGLVRQTNTGSPVSFSYTLGGRDVESWHPRFSYTGFRYVQAEGDTSTLLELEGHFVHSSARVVGSFSCSNQLLNRIHELILAAIRSNMQSILTDCPHREKLGWLEQTHLMGPAITFNFDASRLYAKIMADMRDAQRDDGCVPTIAPQYTTFKPPWDVFNDSPEWGSALVLNPWLLWQRYGDRQVIRDNYESMKRYVEYLDSRAQDCIIDYGLGDWYDIGPGEPGFSKLTSKALTATAIYYLDVAVLQRAAELLDRREDTAAYMAKAQHIRQAFNARFFNPQTNHYDRGSQTANAMPLALGLVEPQHRQAVLENLIRDIRAHDNHTTAGDIGFHFVLRALAEAGRSDVIFDMLTRTDPPSYGYQLQRGATSLTEAWDANPKGSQNHFMLGHAEAWFYQYLAGIQIDLSRPAGEQIVIKPAIVGDITWAKASYDSVLGTISSQWQRDGGALSLHVTIPENCSAFVYVPRADAKAKPVDVQPAAGATLVGPHLGDEFVAVYEVRGGQYSFSSPCS